MAFLWGASAQQQEWDQLIDKSTSDLLPANSHIDLPTALHLADLLRSAAVPPAHATSTLVARLRHANPNVQLLALELADLCIKNGGTPFLLAFAKGAADQGAAAELELLARGVKAGGGVHREVKERVLARLQDWATAFKAKDQLKDSELVRVYDRLTREGVQFPPRDPTATAAMVDSLSAPDWTDAPYCTRCRTEFSTFNRKHHCRNCGQVFDAQCSSGTAALPHYGILEPVRVCDGCAKKIREGKGASVAAASAAGGLARSQSFSGAAAARPAGVERSKTMGGARSAREREDEDLRRAIEASLKDVEPDSLPRNPAGPPVPVQKPGYHTSYASQVQQSDAKKTGSGSVQPAAGGANAGEDDDPDLTAAIAASLRDLQPPATAPAFARSETASTYGPALTYSQLFPSSSAGESYGLAAPSAPKSAWSLPSYDLTPSESATLSDFIAAYASPSGHPPPPFAGPRERRLYADASTAEARLARAQEDARRRREILGEMEWKLSEAARLYGAGLTERASYRPSTTSRTSSYVAHHIPSQPTAHYDSQQQQRYQYAPSAVLTGQPLPAYAVPPVAAPPLAGSVVPAEAYRTPPREQPEQRAAPPAHAPAQPVPAGFYKPSQFPSVPTGAQGMLFPSVPQGEPWRRAPGAAEGYEEEETDEVEVQAKTGELIEL